MSHNTRVANLAHELFPVAAMPHQQLVVEATAKSVKLLVGYAAPVAKAKYILVQVVGGTVRTTSDGVTAPSATLGFLRADGFTAVIPVAEWKLLKVILASGTPKLEVQGYTY